MPSSTPRVTLRLLNKYDILCHSVHIYHFFLIAGPRQVTELSPPDPPSMMKGCNTAETFYALYPYWCFCQEKHREFCATCTLHPNPCYKISTCKGTTWNPLWEKSIPWVLIRVLLTFPVATEVACCRQVACRGKGERKNLAKFTIFHQPGFPWNKGISLTAPFQLRSCEVAIIWPFPRDEGPPPVVEGRANGSKKTWNRSL